jgi:integrase
VDIGEEQMTKPNGNGHRGLYKRVMGLKANETLPDPTVPGLRYVARGTAAGGVTVYAQLRYRHPVTGKWTPEGLGKVPSQLEVDAMAEALIEQTEAERPGGSLVVRADDVAFAAIRDKALKQLGMVRTGVDPKAAGGPLGVTVEEAIVRHIEAPRDKPLEASTLTYYAKAQRLWLSPWLKVPLRRLDGPAVVKIWETLHSDHGRHVALMSMRLLSAAWSTARFHDSRLSPFPKLPRGAMSGSAPKKSALPASSLAQWFKELPRVEGQRPDLWLLGIMTGLRRGDLATVRREHVDLGRATLHLPKPKGGARRAYTIPLSDAALALVERVLRSHNSEWLFPSPESKSGHIARPEPLPTDGFTVNWSMHDLRRTYASIAAAVLSNDFHISALMNHKKKGVTAGYVQLEPDDLRASQQAVTDRLRKLGLPI